MTIGSPSSVQESRPPRWPLWIALLLIAGVVAGILLTRMQAQAAPQQPIDFSHQVHAESGVQCLFCHSAAARSDIAGIPSVEHCMGCHTLIAADSEAIQAVTEYWETEEPIAWVRVNRQPDFVYFSHQPHLLAGVNCETCHGPVGQMDTVYPVVNMDMGWCLECHLERPEEDIARLADCLACHK